MNRSDALLALARRHELSITLNETEFWHPATLLLYVAALSNDPHAPNPSRKRALLVLNALLGAARARGFTHEAELQNLLAADNYGVRAVQLAYDAIDRVGSEVLDEQLAAAGMAER